MQVLKPYITHQLRHVSSFYLEGLLDQERHLQILEDILLRGFRLENFVKFESFCMLRGLRTNRHLLWIEPDYNNR